MNTDCVFLSPDVDASLLASKQKYMQELLESAKTVTKITVW